MSTTRASYAGRWCVNKLEVCRLRLDLSLQDELIGGDTLTGTPTVTMTDPDGSNVTVSGPTVDSGTKLSFLYGGGSLRSGDSLASNGNGYSDYAARISCGTAGGATLVRTASVRVEE